MSLRRVEIAVRVRAPENPRDASCVSLDLNTHHVHVGGDTDAGTSNARRSYREDFLFDEHVSNHDIFDKLVLPKMQSTSPDHPDTLCFLAYGHTSSGKTHSIAGSDEEPGVLRLCVEELLRREGVVEVAMLEVYMDSVNDLLAEGQSRQIRRRQGPQGPVIVVEDLTTCSLTTVDQWNAVSAYGMRSRRTAPTERNARSSRSHAIFTIKSHSVRLCLVDLAGSERQTVFSPQLNRESISINKSLSRLSTVLEALSSQRVTEDGRRTYVNFRDTTLTVLLQRYLTGASLTTFLACVHPSLHHLQETLSTLRYTQRLKRIRTRGAAAVRAEEWSGLKPVENQALLDELMRLRERVRVNENTSKLVEAAQQRRIIELEGTLAAQQQQQRASPAQGATTSGGGDADATVAASRTAIANERVRDTRRVAGWLLSRVLGELPELNVGYDDYFDGFFPPSVQVIGYVSTMAALVPRTAASDPLAFLDVGDFSMGLTMLDAGIPPFVRLHRAGCVGTAKWDCHEWGVSQSVVYVLAFFEYHSTAMTSAADTSSTGEALPCCGGFVTSSSLLPIATVLCVPTSTNRHVKETVLQRLIDLQCEQQEAVEDQVGGESPATSASPIISPLPSRSNSDDGLPAAGDLLDTSLVDEEDAAAAARDSGCGEGGANAESSLLAQEVRRQAADTSHLVTPFKDSSSTNGGSRCSSPGAAEAENEDVGEGRVGAINVRRDLLPDLVPAAHPAVKREFTVPPPTLAGATADHEDVGQDEPAADTPKLQVPSRPLQSAGKSSAGRRPPPSPTSPPSTSVTPAISKRPRKGGKGDHKTARAHGCSGCSVV